MGGAFYPACWAIAGELDLPLGDTRGRDVNALFLFYEISEWAIVEEDHGEGLQPNTNLPLMPKHTFLFCFYPEEI